MSFFFTVQRGPYSTKPENITVFTFDRKILGGVLLRFMFCSVYLNIETDYILYDAALFY